MQECFRAGLAACGEAAGVGDGEAEILVGVDGSVVDADFVVEMGSGAAAAEADESDGVAALDVLSGDDGEVCQVAIAGGDAVAVVKDDGASVASHEVGELHDAIGRGDDRLSEGSGNIHPGGKRLPR